MCFTAAPLSPQKMLHFFTVVLPMLRQKLHTPHCRKPSCSVSECSLPSCLKGLSRLSSQRLKACLLTRNLQLLLLLLLHLRILQVMRMIPLSIYFMPPVLMVIASLWLLVNLFHANFAFTSVNSFTVRLFGTWVNFVGPISLRKALVVSHTLSFVWILKSAPAFLWRVLKNVPSLRAMHASDVVQLFTFALSSTVVIPPRRK